MSVYKSLKAVRKLSNSSLTSIIDITNLNFADLSSGTLEFLNNIQYNETTNSFQAFTGTFDFVDITDTLSLKLDGIPTFTIDSLGRANGQELLVKVAETKRLRLTDFNDWPDVGVPGEIIYTGIQNQKPQFGEDFIGYLQSRGWVSLTEPGTASYVTLYELMGSPPVPPCPAPNTGILWVGPPGYATASIPTTQTIYYTDENCDIYDLTLGGGGGGNCSYTQTFNFTAYAPLTIPHNLHTTNIHVQIIDTTTNELIDGYISNYQNDSVDITLTQTLTNIKVIVIGTCSGTGGIRVLDEGTSVVSSATKLNFVGMGVSVTNAGSGQADVTINGGPFGNKKYIAPSEILTVSADYQYFIYGNFTVAGIVNNYGQVVIANGAPIILPGGQFNNIGGGMLTVVSLATGDNMQVVILNFTTTALTPITLTHSLGTKEFTYNVRENNVLIDVDLVHIDNNSVQLTTTSNVAAGTIVFQAKI